MEGMLKMFRILLSRGKGSCALRVVNANIVFSTPFLVQGTMINLQQCSEGQQRKALLPSPNYGRVCQDDICLELVRGNVSHIIVSKAKNRVPQGSYMRILFSLGHVFILKLSF